MDFFGGMVHNRGVARLRRKENRGHDGGFGKLIYIANDPRDYLVVWNVIIDDKRSPPAPAFYSCMHSIRQTSL